MKYVHRPTAFDKGLSHPQARFNAPQSLERAQASNRRRQRLALDAERVNRLGARVLFELLDEIARRTRQRPTVERILERFARIDPEALAISGGEKFPHRPILVIAGSDR